MLFQVFDEGCDEVHDQGRRMNLMVSGGMARVERYFKFCVVGGTGMLVDMGMLWLIVALLGWNLSMGKVLAAEAAIVNNFRWNDRWTFRAPRSDAPCRFGRLKRFLKFNLICVTGIGCGISLPLIIQVVSEVLTPLVGRAGWDCGMK